MFNNKTIFVTGGTGSFGQSFIESILINYSDVKKIIVYSRDEYRQFSMRKFPVFEKYIHKLQFIIGDIRDKEHLISSMINVDYVVHAAALKHIDICEYNPTEAIKTNVLGTQNVIEAALTNNVSKVVALSTDKACLPSSLYGSTKNIADKLVISANGNTDNMNTKLAVVRYGNVAGSSGSVIPLFKKLINDGATELPITHYDMTRFYLKVEEAIDMVLYAFEHMVGGELFVKKVPTMRITDLVQAIAPNISTYEIGIRPGEKLHEQMISLDDARFTLEFKDYYLIQPNFHWWKNRFTNVNNGVSVSDNFYYSSDNNPIFLSVEEIKELIKEL